MGGVHIRYETKYEREDESMERTDPMEGGSDKAKGEGGEGAGPSSLGNAQRMEKRTANEKVGVRVREGE